MSATFQDRKSRTWELRLDAPTAKRIAEVTGVKLTDLATDPFLRLSTDPILLVDVIWLLVEKRAQELGIADTEFGENCPDIDILANALVECVLGFFPLSRRSQLRSLISETQETHEQAIAETLSQMQTERGRMAETIATGAVRQLRKSLDSIASANLADGELSR